MSAAPLVIAAAADRPFADIASRSGVDRIVAYHSSYYRRLGLPSVAGLLPWGSANEQTLAMLPPVLQGAGSTPVLATVCANDQLLPRSDMLAAVKDSGATGVLNAPTVGLIGGPLRAVLEAEGLGMSSEMALIAEARHLGMEAWAYVFDATWVEAAMEAGATGLIVHLGITGTTPEVAPRHCCEAALQPFLPSSARKRSEQPTPVLLHGGPLRSPSDARLLLRDLPPSARQLIAGFFGASTFEVGGAATDMTAAVLQWRHALGEDRT